MLGAGFILLVALVMGRTVTVRRLGRFSNGQPKDHLVEAHILWKELTSPKLMCVIYYYLFVVTYFVFTAGRAKRATTI
jgi:hypothetical protein